MNSSCVDRVAITAFTQPGLGRLLVWSAEAHEMLRLCEAKPSFDPSGHIRDLFELGCNDGAHPGREALEDHARAAWSLPESPGALASGSSMGRRSLALTSPYGALDLSLGYLDLLLIVAPNTDEGLPRGPSRQPERSMEEGWAVAWGARVIFCGTVDEEQWDSVEERAAAVLALLERSEISAQTTQGFGTSGTRRI